MTTSIAKDYDSQAFRHHFVDRLPASIVDLDLYNKFRRRRLGSLKQIGILILSFLAHYNPRNSLPDAKYLLHACNLKSAPSAARKDPPMNSPHSLSCHQLFFRLSSKLNSAHSPAAVTRFVCPQLKPPLNSTSTALQRTRIHPSTPPTHPHHAPQTLDRQIHRPNLPPPLPLPRRPAHPRRWWRSRSVPRGRRALRFRLRLTGALVCSVLGGKISSECAAEGGLAYCGY